MQASQPFIMKPRWKNCIFSTQSKVKKVEKTLRCEHYMSYCK